MKLYIATTSLNFDAIVSTDSISPAAFYQQRGFGITLFYDKASFILPNSILLTDAFPIFSINRSEVDHRPMVIEIDTLDYPPYFEAVKKNSDHTVYRTERTIYISPSTSKIYFLSETDRRATLAKAESILESKYLLYVKLEAIKVYDRSIPSTKIGQDSFKKINDVHVPDSRFILRDIGINKAKGFIVSYMIGAKMAITPESARLLRLSKDIKNSIYSLGTKEGRTNDAMNAIYSLANEAEELSSFIDPKKQEARKKVLRYLSSENASSMLRGASEEEIVLFLEKIGVYSSLFNRLNGRRLTSIVGLVQQALSSRDETLTESSLADISSYISSITQHYSDTACVSDLFKLGLDRNYIDCYDPSLELESQKKVEIMYNLYSGYNYKTAGIRENRVDYITDAGVEFFQETNDDNQDERKYVNDLLDNLEHAASFDMMATNSQALQALAVFMRSPDADLDKMASLIVSNEIPDARIAFGLWGLFYGYSNIPQSYYNSFVQSLDNKDAASFVEQIHDALFGHISSQDEEYVEPQKGKSIIQKVLSAVGLGEEKNDEYIEHVEPEGDLFSSAGISLDEEEEEEEEKEEPTHTTNAVQKADVTKASSIVHSDSIAKDTAKASQSNEEVGDMRNGYEYVYGLIEPLLEKTEAKNKKTRDEFFAYYPVRIKEACDNASSLIGLFNAIDSIPGVVAKTAWKRVRQNIKRLIESLQMAEAESRSMAQRERIESVISSGGKHKFYRDEYAWDVILSVLPNDKAIIDKVKEDFSWFMDNYGNPPYYENKPTDNESCLNAFHRYLNNKIEKPNVSPSIRSIYRQVDINSLMSILKEMYS